MKKLAVILALIPFLFQVVNLTEFFPVLWFSRSLVKREYGIFCGFGLKIQLAIIATMTKLT